MVKPIMRDIFFLGQKSEEATSDDMGVAADLQDTLSANKDRCVGMAANMIGVKKRIIIVDMGLVALKVNGWNHDLSPWNAPAGFGNEDFGCGAGEMLSGVLAELTLRRR